MSNREAALNLMKNTNWSITNIAYVLSMPASTIARWARQEGDRSAEPEDYEE